MMDRATVNPPTPESKTPIGRDPMSSLETGSSPGEAAIWAPAAALGELPCIELPPSELPSIELPPIELPDADVMIIRE
jgi:hypothetical protein